MPRRLSGFKPTGHLQLGNYLGAIRPLVDSQHEVDTVAMVVDLHALTVEHDPHRVRELTDEVAACLLACGVDADRALLYVQSHVPAHLELHYLLECATGYGEAHRMIQFRARRDAAGTRLSLLTYPVLMAADVLLHGADEVPVGADQSQHVELARDIASRFNARYGETFVVPRAVNADVGARIMDLARPGTKMGKTNASAAGVLYLLDPPETVRRKVMRAVTDPFGEVRYDPAAQPGVSNLLEILAACQPRPCPPADLAGRFGSYRELKEAVADAVIAILAPIRARYADLRADPAYLTRLLRHGATRAEARVKRRLDRAYAALGLRAAA